jgi:thiamine biosynthesis lipoprotein
MRAHLDGLGLIAASAFAAFGSVLAGCAQPQAPYFETRLYSMGTWVDISIDAPSESAAEAALAEVESMLRDFEVDYYAWANGELARVNEALSEGATVETTAELAALLLEAQRLSGLSAGVFDPGVGELVELWRFHSAAETGAEAPPAETIEEWRRDATRIEALTIEGTRVQSSGRRVTIDLGGIAKGEAVDRAIELLREGGVRNALVNAGGDLRVLGTNRGRPWRIGIQSPREDDVIGVIELADGEAAFTSGDYERYFERDGRRMHHILDPRTGYPAADTQAVTVIAANGVTGDAAATGLFVAGDDWQDVAEAFGIDTVLRVDASGSVEMTQKMRQRLPDMDRERVDDVVVVGS